MNGDPPEDEGPPKFRVDYDPPVPPPPPEDEELEPPSDAFSAAALRDAVEKEEDKDLDEAEGHDWRR